MKIYKTDDFASQKQKCVLALGNFDGVHRGHAKLLKTACAYARKNGISFGIYTFEHNPKSIDGLLTRNREKNILFEDLGADFVYYENFDDVKNLEPHEFSDYIVNKFGAVCAVCGENFRFGKNASGTSSVLKEIMAEKGHDALIVPTLIDGAQPISSTRIRKLIEDGKLEQANAILGYPYGFSAEIVHGASIGHTIGFPTINQLLPKGKICPKHGVYASSVTVDGKKMYGVTNIGVKPTVTDRNSLLSETYIIDFSGNVYGKYADVRLYKMLRPEKKFSGLEELTENIRKNVSETKKYFEGNK